VDLNHRPLGYERGKLLSQLLCGADDNPRGRMNTGDNGDCDPSLTPISTTTSSTHVRCLFASIGSRTIRQSLSGLRLRNFEATRELWRSTTPSGLPQQFCCTIAAGSPSQNFWMRQLLGPIRVLRAAIVQSRAQRVREFRMRACGAPLWVFANRPNS